MSEKRPLSFVDGIGVGIGGLMLLPLLYYAVMRGDLVEMYKQMGPSAKFSTLTRVMFHPAYGWGVPLLLSAAFGLSIWLRPTRWLIFAIGAASLVMSIVTYYGAYQPIFQLAGNIR